MTARNSIFIVLVIACLFWAGCQPTVTNGGKIICPGKASIEEAVEYLSLQRTNAQPMIASADCTMSWRDDKDSEKKEQVSGKMAYVPSGKIFYKGDKFGEIRFGANETEFWLRIKPEVDSYWWGEKSLADECNEMLLVNPAQIAEALGIVEVTADWRLDNHDGYDILSLHEDEKLKKRVYVNTCDYRIEKIEYYDAYGMKKISAELADYWANEDDPMVPTKISVSYFDSLGDEESSVQIELKHIKPMSEKQKKNEDLFKRPGRDGYEHMYRLDRNCEFIEE